MSAVKIKKEALVNKETAAKKTFLAVKKVAKGMYIMKSELTLLKGISARPESHLTSFEKIKMVKNGISKQDLEELKEKVALDYDTLSTVLSVARATLINKKGDTRFDASLSERILALADIYSYGYEVFEDVKNFNQWVARPNRALGGQSPLELLDTQFGREEVKNLIGRIDYGVYS
jgi:putative toxin-antitoxin system antitoxin component (TIGR02293 family)